jgi:glycosyltransferase involved in cell wall biosynthesis
LLREDTDILVVTSQRCETFGNVVVEALASGVPVVATRCGGPEDIVADEVGRLVPIGDPDALARAIREVWEQRDGFPPERLARYARERFSQERIAAQLIALYEEILRGQG